MSRARIHILTEVAAPSRTHTLITWAALALLLPAAVVAQGPVAVVVNGVPDAASVREPVFGALRARGHSPVAADTVDAAIAFALFGEPVTAANAPSLREAVGATVLYLVSVRPAEGRDVFFAVEVFDATGTRSAFGRAPSAGLAGAVVTELLSLDASAPAAPAPALGAGAATAVVEGTDEPAPDAAAPAEPAPQGEGTGPQSGEEPAAESREDVMWSAGAAIAVVGSDGFDNSHSQLIFHLAVGQRLEDDWGIGLAAYGGTPSFDEEHYPGWFVGTLGFVVSGVVVGVGGGALIPAAGDPVGAFALGVGGTAVFGEHAGIAVDLIMLLHSDPIRVDIMLGIGFGIGGPNP